MRAAALVALIAGGVAGGYFVGRQQHDRELPRTVVVERAGTREIVTRQLGPDSDALRAIIREEVGRGACKEAASPEPPVQPASEAAFAHARSLVDAALSLGSWSEHDREALRADLPSLTRDQFETLGRILMPALNDGRVRTTFAGTPL